MKILKTGKAKQRKFACPDCEGVFIASKSEMFDGIGYSVICPCCQNKRLWWDDGEPYEEPTPTQTDRERLQRLIYTMPGYQGSTGEGADYLIANGVTFVNS